MESRAQVLHLTAARWSPVCLLLLICCSNPVQNQTDYQAIFGRDYENAQEIINAKTWWSDSLQNNGIEPGIALSVIFPELIRYSSIRDYIETRALEVLYVQYGADYADFSVGLFQMKPTFAEQVETDLLKYDLTEEIPALYFPGSAGEDTQEARRERILRLKDERMQLHYLVAFIRIMDKIYPRQAILRNEEKLVFYATAYNAGYFKGENHILKETESKRFYTGMTESREKHCYAAIALDYYLQTFRK